MQVVNKQKEMRNKYFDRITSEVNKTTFFSKYWLALVLAITVLSINYSYSITMMFLTTFTLAYLSKGSRRK